MTWRGISKTLAAVVAIIIVIIAILGAYYAYMSRVVTPTITVTTTVTTTVVTTTAVTSPASPTTSPTTTQTITTTPTTTTTVVTTPKPSKAFHERAVIITIEDPVSRTSMLQSGTADFGEIPIESIPSLLGQKMDNFEIVMDKVPPEPRILGAILNCYKGREIFNNSLVRQALAYATPYELIIETVAEGYMVPLHVIIPRGLLGYTEYGIINYTAIPYEKRLEIAKDLIKKSGIDPTKYSFVIWYDAGNVVREKTATLLAQSWSKLGFKISTEAVPWAVMQKLGYTPEGFWVRVTEWGPDYLDPDNTYASMIFYGGTKFKEINVNVVESPDEVSKYLKTALVVETKDYYVVVGEKGSGAKITVSGKPIIVVSYIPDWEKTPPIEECIAYANIGPAFYRNVSVDALILAARWETNPDLRRAMYEALCVLWNRETPVIIIGQYIPARPYWNWVKGRYYNPLFLFERFDLLWEDPNAPTIPIGIGDLVNDPNTLVFVTHRWPKTFDGAFNYEVLGWALLNNIGSTLVTFWKDEAKEVSPGIAVAWAHSSDGTRWYFVIRGGVKAYDPWHDKVYDISATDVLFTLWRIARLGGDPSWMITGYIDINASYVLTESEFESLLSKEPLIAEYKGQVKQIKSLSDLLELFGYTGPTAGVVCIKLLAPYSAILSILADPFAMIIPAKYLFDNVDNLKGKYEEAMEAAEWGKKPAAWAEYIGIGENEPTHLYLHKHPISTGPYYIKEYVEGSYIVLEYNPHYWNATLWEQLYGFKP